VDCGSSQDGDMTSKMATSLSLAIWSPDHPKQDGHPFYPWPPLSNYSINILYMVGREQDGHRWASLARARGGVRCSPKPYRNCARRWPRGMLSRASEFVFGRGPLMFPTTRLILTPLCGPQPRTSTTSFPNRNTVPTIHEPDLPLRQAPSPEDGQRGESGATVSAIDSTRARAVAAWGGGSKNLEPSSAVLAGSRLLPRPDVERLIFENR
jgi:hypothetical protein